jgi:hypothetical protein
MPFLLVWPSFPWSAYFFLPVGVWPNTVWCRSSIEYVKKGIGSHFELKHAVTICPLISLYTATSIVLCARGCNWKCCSTYVLTWGRHSVVSIVTRLRTAQFRVRFLSGARFFFFSGSYRPLPAVKRPGLLWTIRFHLILRIIMSATIQRFRLYASVGRTGTTLPFTFLFYHCVQHDLCVR